MDGSIGTSPEAHAFMMTCREVGREQGFTDLEDTADEGESRAGYRGDSGAAV